MKKKQRFRNFFHSLTRLPSMREEYNLIDKSQLFDSDYYTSVYGNFRPSSNPLEHYIAVGHKQKNDPNPFFSTSFYLHNNPDVKKKGMNPLYHYIKYGETEGRSPNPFFNPKIYLKLNPDLRHSQTTLLLHYQQHGQRENRPYQEHTSSTQLSDPSTAYQRWITKNEQKKTFREIDDALHAFSITPKISILVPVYNTDRNFLIDCIESVRNQSYSNWELCLADDSSTEPHVAQILDSYAQQDSRIKVISREHNGHISAATNSALEVATGSWVALLDHDDLLHEHSLFYAVQTINTSPQVEFIYSDEDKITEQGYRTEPHFKPQWNLNLLYSQNYVSHLGLYKTEILKNIGGFRVGYEGSQDYDLLLRYSLKINHKNIIHIPKILYHWRMAPGSTALLAEEKPYTTEVGIKALKDHFSSLQQDVTVEQGKHTNIYKVHWKHKEKPLVSLIIPTHNSYEITKRAIESIQEKTSYTNFEIVLVDNNSNDPEALSYFHALEKDNAITLLSYHHPFNYAAITNFAVQKAKGSIIGLINNDIEVISPEWLTEMVSHSQRPEIGCVGAMLYYPNDTIQHAGIIIGIGGVAGHSHKHFKRGSHGYFSRLNVIHNISAVTGACLVVRKEIFNQVQGFDANNLPIAFNDVDFCLKVQQAGYNNLWTPYAELYHHESYSRGPEDSPEKITRFNNETNYIKSKWHTDQRIDPCYSPHLTLAREDFSYDV